MEDKELQCVKRASCEPRTKLWVWRRVGRGAMPKVPNICELNLISCPCQKAANIEQLSVPFCANDPGEYNYRETERALTSYSSISAHEKIR